MIGTLLTIASVQGVFAFAGLVALFGIAAVLAMGAAAMDEGRDAGRD